MDKNLIILEYNEALGKWHYNMVQDNVPRMDPDTYEWVSIAYTEERKARVFTNMMDCKINRRKNAKKTPYTAPFMKREWKMFCYVYNSIIKTIDITDEEKELVSEKFDSAQALARLGHGAYIDMMEERGLEAAEIYDPLNFLDANF